MSNPNIHGLSILKENNNYSYYDSISKYISNLKSELSKNSSTFYIIGSIFAAVSGYYLYNNYFKGRQFNEEQLTELEGIKQLISENKDVLNSEIVLKIYSITNKRYDYLFNLDYEYLNKNRRSVIDNPIEYKKSCKDYLIKKEELLGFCSNEIVNYLDVDHEFYINSIKELTHKEIESKYLSNHIPTFNGDIPDKNKTKEAFLYFSNLFVDEISKIKSKKNTIYTNSIKSYNDLNDEIKRNHEVEEILITKIKIDDLLYIKHGLTESQVRYLVHDYNLIEDKEVNQANESLITFETIFFM